MRKIFSILVVLGLVLGMAAVATPAAAQVTKTVPTGCSTLTFNPSNCEGQANVIYTFNFTSPKQMFGGQDAFMVEFPVGTTIGAFGMTDVTVGGVPYPSAASLAAHVTRPAANIIRIVPQPGTDFGIGDTVLITIGKITNPATGSYTINLWHDRDCCDAEAFCAITYTIRPAKSTYKFVLDFGDTYEDIALDFVPPFKACGQPGYGVFDEGQVPYLEDTGHNFTAFNITLMTDDEGCLGYGPVIINFWLEDAPADSTVSLYLYGWNGTPGSLGWHLFELTLDDEVPHQWGFAPAGFNITAVYAENTMALVHFDTVGDYEVCFELEYLGVPDDCSPIEGGILAERCIEAKVYQDKEAFQLGFGPKWNLMSLPLIPFETDIDAILAAMNEGGLSQLKSIWNYDRCSDAWFAWGNGQTSLTDIEDGKAYWVRMLKATEEDFDLTAFPVTLWVFGTARPMPPQGPPSYAVCEGPNMVGFLPMWNFAPPSAPLTAEDEDYLWNFWDISLAYPDYGTIYGWDGVNWAMGLPGNVTLQPGQGYWMVFERDGVIYP